MEENPFPDLTIADHSFLNEKDGREECNKCNKTRRYFCYTCNVPVPSLAPQFPRVKLPISVDIIKHPNEIPGKSTACHAAIIAPDDVQIFIYPTIPHYTEPEKVLMLFPSKFSLPIEEWKRKIISKESTAEVEEGEDKGEVSKKRSCSSPGSSAKRPKTEELPFNKIVFIDSTWAQSKKISSDPRLKDLSFVELKSQTTKFWRHQKGKPKTYLATIEAIFYFFQEYHSAFSDCDYDGRYDNLLFLFNFMYHKIRGLHDNGKDLKAYNAYKDEEH